MRKKSLSRLEAKIIRAARWFTVVITYVLLIYSYYVYVAVFCIYYLIYIVDQRTKAALYLAFYHILFLLTIISFTQATFREPGDTRKVAMLLPQTVGPRLPESIELDPFTTSYCSLCQQYKPARTHHCSDCQKCCLKMDHHCVWLNNCVGFGNYKFFYLTSFYGTLLCALVFATLLQILIWQLSTSQLIGNSVQFLILTVFAGVLGLGCLVLFGFHTYIITKGRTTIEEITWKEYRDSDQTRRKPPEYDQGVKENISDALGANWYLYPVPIRNTKGTGTSYKPTDSQNSTSADNAV
jgi:hypothetical protein